MCSGCHLAPGMKRTEISRGLYPRAPELRHKTDLTPAEQFWIVKHGVKMTGMPYRSKRSFKEGTFSKLGKVLPDGAQLRVTNVIIAGDMAVVELVSDASARNGMRFDNHYCWVTRFHRIFFGGAYLEVDGERFDARNSPALRERHISARPARMKVAVKPDTEPPCSRPLRRATGAGCAKKATGRRIQLLLVMRLFRSRNL